MPVNFKDWEKKQRDGKTREDQRGKNVASNPFIGRPGPSFPALREKGGLLESAGFSSKDGNVIL